MNTMYSIYKETDFFNEDLGFTGLTPEAALANLDRNIKFRTEALNNTKEEYVNAIMLGKDDLWLRTLECRIKDISQTIAECVYTKLWIENLIQPVYEMTTNMDMLYE